MSIDPRMLKQLIQIQFANKIDLLTPMSNKAAAEDDTAFGDLLQSLLDSKTDASSGAKPSASSNALEAMLGLRSFMPNPVAGKPADYDPLIRQAASRFGVDANLVKAVVDAESSFQPYAVSSAGAKGLMQLMDGTAAGLGVTDSFDPEQNVNGGTQYLAGLLRKYKGNELVALAAYNAGPNRIDRLGIATDRELMDKLAMLPQETQNYVHKVQALKKQYASQ